MDHVFSCEIEPFKQAYIERNFAPPILFRDIRELDEDQATTAYGALVDVPGNVDMLVAGRLRVHSFHSDLTLVYTLVCLQMSPLTINVRSYVSTDTLCN